MFVSQLNACFNLVLRDDCLLLSSKKYVELRRNLKWLSRFHELGERTLIDKTSKSKNVYANLDEITLILRVHYKWLVKFVKTVLDLRGSLKFGEDCRSEMERLSAMIDTIDSSVTSVNDPFRKITKRMKKYLATPLPFSSEISVAVYTIVKKLSSELARCTSDRAESTLKRDLKIILLQNDETMKLREELIDHWTKIYIDRDFDETTIQILRDAEEFCDRCHLGLRTPIEISEVLAEVETYRERRVIDISANVQLWPVYEYIFYVLVNNMHGKMCGDRSVSSTSHALDKLSRVPSLPINLIALLKAIALRTSGTIERDRLIPEFFTGLHNFAQESCAFRDSKIILHWRGISETDMEKSMTNPEDTKIDNPLYGPVLLNLVSELILNKTQSIHEKSILSTAQLGTYRSRMRQLKTLNGLLWRNSSALNSPEYDRSRNDLLALKYYTNKFLDAEDKMEKEQESALVVQSEISKQVPTKRIELEAKFTRDYVEPLTELKRRSKAFDDPPEDWDRDEVERAKSWMLLGYLQVFLFSNLGHIDPVHKISLKLRYVLEDIEDCRKTLYVAALNARVNGDLYPSSNTHPRTVETAKCLERLIDVKNELASSRAIRPSTMEFIALAKETSNFRNTLGSYEVVAKITNKLSQAIDELRVNTNDSAKSIVAATDGIQEAEIWQESLNRFSVLLEKKFLPGYPDIVTPLLTAVGQLRHGARTLSDEARRLMCLRKSSNGSAVQKLMHNLIRFPSIGHEQKDLLCLVDSCTSQRTREFINANVMEKTEDTFVSIAEQFRMVKSGLHELYNHITLERELNDDLWRELNGLLQQIVLIWQSQRNESAKRAAEEDSMYRNKVKIHGNGPSEDEEIAEELRNLFPTTRDADFTEIEAINEPTLESRIESNGSSPEDSRRRYSGLISEEDVSEVHELHSRIVSFFVDTPWLRKRLDVDGRDYVEPLIQRYSTFGLLVENLAPALDNRLTSKLYASLNFLTSVTVRTSEGLTGENSDSIVEGGARNQRKPYDFYKSSNVEEAKQCLPLLESTMDRVDGFLKEWPEHPTLRSIRAIIQRIYGFSITSPISRFLTGLELLLVKMREWEENAHSGVSLSEYSLALTQQIISWRKLELACWKDCLNTAHARLRSKASKWWFFLYALIESYITRSSLDIDSPEADETAEVPNRIEEPVVTAKKLTELLEAFINDSSLVEFQARLDLLLTFHSHAYHLDESQERDELLAILWNVHNYYKQFVVDVEKKIRSLKAPIEKKLRDFVKIARWNDINYWSVKETVEKTHRTLHKFIREFETGLKVPVVTCLLVKPSSYSGEADRGEWDRPKERDYSIDPRDFVIAGKSISKQLEVRNPQNGSILREFDFLFRKYRYFLSVSFFRIDQVQRRLFVK